MGDILYFNFMKAVNLEFCSGCFDANRHGCM